MPSCKAAVSRGNVGWMQPPRLTVAENIGIALLTSPQQPANRRISVNVGATQRRQSLTKHVANAVSD
jgi:hypothetical protein